MLHFRDAEMEARPGRGSFVELLAYRRLAGLVARRW